jgi:ABC-type sugar transport system ATPase subunit
VSTVSQPPATVSASGITKHYGAVRALDGVDIELRPGEIVGLLGDNGAGKSTLAGILSGAVVPTSGEISIEGVATRIESPLHARNIGIEMVFQDLALAPDLTIAENMFLGREQLRRRSGPFHWVDRREMERRSAQELEALSVRVRSVKARCGDLSGGQRQGVAIARAVVWSSKALLLDEPTAALGVEQQAQVANLIKDVAGRGVAVLLITHNMQQVMDLCDRVVVLWRGRSVANLKSGEYDIEGLVQWITGAKVMLQEQGR